MKKAIQTTIFNTPVKTCAFTGHRTLERDFSPKKCKAVISQLIENGAEVFLCGMARGFDLFAAKVVLSFKKKYPNVRLIACIPCPDQDRFFSETEKKQYAQILQKADEKRILFDKYHNGCMLSRNRYMADNADALIAYLRNDEGGTAYTVGYFTKKYPFKQIFYI